MYVLQNNVEIISGARNYCIYNLNTKKLYNLTPDYMERMRKILDSNYESSDNLEVIKDYLLAEGIIVKEGGLVEKLTSFENLVHPEFAWIEITQNCNLLCRHCYEGSSRSVEKPYMSMSDFVIAVEYLAGIGVSRIQLVGGEPIIHPKIKEMITIASDRFSSVEIFTNGTLLTDNLIKVIRDNGVSLAFSVYAKDPALHDKVTRTKGSYHLTSSTIAKVLSMGINVRIASVEMVDVPKFDLSDFAVEHRTDFPRLTGRASLSLYTDDMLRRKLITKKTFSKPLDPIQYSKNRLIHNCFGELLYIDCDLNVFPCAMERRVSYGNLRTSSTIEESYSRFARINKDKIEGCRDCEYRYACYDCRPDCNHTAFESKPWFCTYDQENGVWIDTDKFIALLRSES